MKNNALLKKLFAETFVGKSKKEAPSTMVKLHTIAPTAVFKPISTAPLLHAMSDTVVSGNVVAIATIVAPTKSGGILNLFANATALETSISPPFKIKTIPNIKTTMVNNVVINKKYDLQYTKITAKYRTHNFRFEYYIIS